MFVDWKITFDNIDRERMWRVLEKKEINLRRRRRMEKIYEETEVMVRTKEEFKLNKEVRQRCLLGTLLFNVHVADLDRELEKRGIGNVELDKERIWSLGYADDIVLVEENREALNDIIDTLSRFLKKKRLQ